MIEQVAAVEEEGGFEHVVVDLLPVEVPEFIPLRQDGYAVGMVGGGEGIRGEVQMEIEGFAGEFEKLVLVTLMAPWPRDGDLDPAEAAAVAGFG